MGTAKQEAAGSEAGMSYEFMHRAHRASTEGRKMGGSVGVWGTPCSIQRGLTRRLCILLVCTEALRVSTETSRSHMKHKELPVNAAGRSVCACVACK